jgi:hypothetical protein
VISESPLENSGSGKVHQPCDWLGYKTRFDEVPYLSKREQGDIGLNGARKTTNRAGVKGLLSEEYAKQGRLELLDVFTERWRWGHKVIFVVLEHFTLRAGEPGGYFVGR